MCLGEHAKNNLTMTLDITRVNILHQLYYAITIIRGPHYLTTTLGKLWFLSRITLTHIVITLLEFTIKNHNNS